MARKLRIATSVFFAVVTVALVMLWVRSYWWHDSIQRFMPYLVEIASEDGHIIYWKSYSTWERDNSWHFESQRIGDARSQAWSTGTRISHWFPIAFFAAVAASPWIPYSLPISTRFSLRTLFFATTLAATALGLAVWLTS